MKAAIYYGIGKVGVEERPDPKPGPKDVIVKTIRSGICGSDVTGYLHGGKYVGIRDNSQFGHETAGVVYEVGSEVKDVPVGMRVFVNPVTSVSNYRLVDMAGGFNQYMTVLNAKIGYNLYELPENVSFDEAAIVEPFSVSTHGKNIPNTKPEDHVVIYGAGTIGLCALAAALNSGVQNPVVVDPAEHRLALAREIGAATFNPTTGDIREFLTGHFGGIQIRSGETPNVDVAIDCAGAPTIVGEVIEYSKPGTKYVQIAVPKEPVPIKLARLMSTEAVLMGSCGYTDADIREVLDCLERRSTKIQKIVTHHFPLDQIEEAFKVAVDPAQSVKVIIDMD